MMRLHVVRRVQRNHLRRRQQLFQSHIFKIKHLGKKAILPHVEGQHIHAKTFCHANHVQADMPGADDPERFPLQIKSHQAVPRKIAVRGAHVSAMNITRQRENQTESMFGDGVFAVKWNVGHSDITLAARFQINMIEARRARGDQF